MVAGEDGENAVEAGDFVDDEGERDELGRGAERYDMEKGLTDSISIASILLSMVQAVRVGRRRRILTRGLGNRRLGAMAVFVDGGSQRAYVSSQLQNGSAPLRSVWRCICGKTRRAEVRCGDTDG